MVQKCLGCGKRIQGGEQALSRHVNRCAEYQQKFSAVPSGTQPGPAAAGASASAAVASSTTPSYSLDARRPKKRKRTKTAIAAKSTPSESGPSSAPSVSDEQPSAGNSPGISTGPSMEIDEDPFRDQPMAEASPPPASPPPLVRRQRANRGKLPTRFVQNTLPEGPAPLPDDEDVHEEQTVTPAAPRRVLQVGNVRIRLDTTRTEENSFGVSRVYFGRPTSVPDAFTPLESMLADRDHPVEAEVDARPEQDIPLADRIALAIAPYPNFSSWLLNKYYWSADRRSQEDRRALIHDVLLHELFDTEELRAVNFKALDEEIARLDADDPSATLGRGWKKSPVTFQVPHGHKTSPPTKESCTFKAAPILHRSIPDLVSAEFSKPAAAGFHYTPFYESWTSPTTGKAERLHSELFSSQAFVDAHNELQDMPPEPGCSLPRAIAGLCLMSDSAHLTDTGNAHIHPFNVAFANESMYSRGKPSNHSVHPVMHLPALSDTDLMTFVGELTGKPKAKGHPIYTHCRREYFQGALKLLFDAEFWDMYAHGKVVECADGVTRRLYLRLFVYSADYPEKVLVATIRDGGGCPCPRCLVRKEDLSQMGTAEDLNARESNKRVDDPDRRAKVKRARKFLSKGFAVTYAGIDKELKDESYVPVENAFSVQDGSIRLNVFELLAVDLMHEIELGVWMALLAHLIRILYAIDAEMVTELNRRYRQIPTFGRDVIRQLSDHVCDMTRMTAHEYANMLESAPPCFEGLFGEWDGEIQSLLFTLALWHSLAKMRVHTDSTLVQLRHVTCDFGDAIRKFQNGCCEAFDTYETESERQKRLRHAQAAAARTNAGSTAVDPEVSKRQPRKFTVDTYKFHSMGDYASTIARLGSTYNYTTAVNELSHRSPIAAYQRSNKKDFENQIVKIENIRSVHRDIQQRLDALAISPQTLTTRKKRSDEHDDIVGDGSSHYIIAADEGEPKYLSRWLRSLADDEAYTDFEYLLRCHLLSRLTKEKDITKRYEKKYTDRLTISGNRIFSHARLRINYTSYDMRRAQDCINCNTNKSNIMLLADDESGDAQHAPFWYARVLGVFHARVYHPMLTPNGARRLEFLWVRWLGADPDWEGGWAARRLDRIGYVPSSDADAFGFIDPKLVLRACHLLPGFAHGRTMELLAPSKHSDSGEGDWKYYYVNRFPDCDMLQRFLGQGIGHTSNRTQFPDTSEPVEWASDPISCPAETRAGTSTAIPPSTVRVEPVRESNSSTGDMEIVFSERDLAADDDGDEKVEEVRDPVQEWIF